MAVRSSGIGCRAIVATLAILSWMGCASEAPGQLTWKVTTTSTTIVDAAASYEAEIRRGSCTGPIEYRDVFTEAPRTPPVLRPGDYAFLVRVRGADCRVLAEGCEVVALPIDEECVEVVVEEEVGPGCAPDATCQRGVCTGGPDAGLDGATDAPPADTALDTRIDTMGCSPCDDGIPCTRDRCDGDECIHESNDDACDDGFACTLDECSVITGCSNTPRHALCDDANECTDDSCVPMTGCVNAENTDPCDDGEYCNGADTCGGGTCSSHAGNPCGATCVEDTDSCRSDCFPGVIGAWVTGRACMGTLVDSEMFPAFGGGCTAFCEDTSETTGTPVDCCAFEDSICYAYSGNSVLYPGPSGRSARSCRN